MLPFKESMFPLWSVNISNIAGAFNRSSSLQTQNHNQKHKSTDTNQIWLWRKISEIALAIKME